MQSLIESYKELRITIEEDGAGTGNKYLTPIAEEVIASAKELGNKLAESFTRELESPKQIS